jgi:uncharacterized membrane-anchored protein
VKKGILVAVLQCGIVLSLAGKYAVDRNRLPRVWVRCAPYDPNLPLRGRYIRLRLIVAADDKRFPDRAALNRPLAYFIAEHAEDPSQQRGKDLWVEVTVPPEGAPRPIRIAARSHP